ncbi:KH domain-containing protein [Aphelenchoides fujianensis]|nr:KH domain-containing protein [Aphelenchoides fujianensis]
MNVLNAHCYRLDNVIYRRNAFPSSRRSSASATDAPVCWAARPTRTRTASRRSRAKDPSSKPDNMTSSQTEAVAQPEESNGGPIAYNAKLKVWTAQANVPALFMGLFCGAGNSNVRKIESSTDCKVEVPKKGSSSSTINIKSTVGRENVERCLDQVEMFVLKQRERARPNHFVSFFPPIARNAQLLAAYQEFMSKIKNSSSVPVSDRSNWVAPRPEFFTPPAKLHATVCTLCLLSDEEVEQAKGSVGGGRAASPVRTLIKGQPLVVNVRGLNHFGDEDPSAARVLWAKLSGTKLPDIARLIYEHMAARGLAKKEKRTQQIHMTLMNTKPLAEAEERDRTFDATAILAEFAGFDFASAEVKDVQLCLMGEVDSNTGGYPVVSSVPLR